MEISCIGSINGDKINLQEGNTDMKGKPQKQVPTGIKYYAVFYLYNDTVHAIPFDSYEEAEKESKKWMERITKEIASSGLAKNHKPEEYIKNFYISKRNMDKYPNGEVF